MNTLHIEKPLSLDIGVRSTLASLFAGWADRIADWHHRNYQRELEAYLGGSQNMADLEHRLRQLQHTERQTLV